MKTELREKYREIRKQVFCEPSSTAILRWLENFRAVQYWLVYASVADEFPTRPIFEFLIRHRKKVFFPRSVKTNLHFHQVNSWQELAPKGFLLEPSEEALKFHEGDSGLALVPGLVFNRLGQRIGYGKAYYDRFLRQSPKVLRIGLGFDQQISLESWPEEAHDQRMDYVLSPSGLWGSRRAEF